MEDKINISIDCLHIEGSAAALTALIGAVQGRPQSGTDVENLAQAVDRELGREFACQKQSQSEFDAFARQLSRSLLKSIRDSAAEAKQRREKRTDMEPPQD